MSGLKTKEEPSKDKQAKPEARSFFGSRGFKIFIIVTILGSFAMNIHTAFVSSDLDTLRFLVCSGFGLAALWFLLYLGVDAANTRLHKELHRILHDHHEFIMGLANIIDNAVEERAEAEKKEAKSTSKITDVKKTGTIKATVQKKAPIKKQAKKSTPKSKVISDIKE
jgi:hypothetical protein